MSTNGVASSAEQLHDRLNDPKVADGLNRLLDRLDIVSFAVESMDGFIKRGEVIADSVTSTVGDLKGVGDESTLELIKNCLLYTSPSPRDRTRSRMPSSA